ncbi:MAG: hypothetical protein KDD15_05790 [Lewinella sp.]|nr:hypothetical protein [Lewinella sp.]
MNKHTTAPNPLPALLAFNLIVYSIAGYYFSTGLSPMLMLLIGLLTGLVVMIILYYVLFLLGKVVQRLPLKTGAAILASLIGLVLLKSNAFRWPDQLYYPTILVGIALSVIVYFALRNIASRQRLLWSWAGIGLTVVLVLAGLSWLREKGEDPFVSDLPAPWAEISLPTLASKGLENPAEAGAYNFSQFTYGSGTDQKREEYAAGVTYRTNSVDATRMLSDWKGKKKKWREKYWGFGVGAFPLNGRVFLPKGTGPFPLVLIVHGNHSMLDYSDGGYAYLGEMLASRGYIAVSVDENFLNGHWSGDFRGKEMPTRAWLLLKHLEQWRKWNDDPTHELSGKADLSRVMLIGHSRGGEAVSIAAAFNQLPYFPDDAREAFNFNFGIKGVVAIAPTDYRYHRQISLENVNFLSLQGSYDADETSFWGMRAYRRLRFTDGNPWFKAGVYLHRANHGQFNSSWGSADFGGPFQWLLNQGGLIDQEDQQTAAKIFISAFAEAALKDRRDYLPIFENAALARDWLPENYYLTHFTDNGSQVLLNFEEDIDVTTGGPKTTIRTENFKLWREEELATRDHESQENNAVIIGWDYGEEINRDSLAVYEVTLKDSVDYNIDPLGSMQIILAALDPNQLPKNDPSAKKRKATDLDLHIELVDGQGQRAIQLVSNVKRIAPILKTRFTKLSSLDKDMLGADWEVQPETFHLSLSAFALPNGSFDFSALRSIRLIFNQTPYGVIAVDDIGFDIAK